MQFLGFVPQENEVIMLQEHFVNVAAQFEDDFVSHFKLTQQQNEYLSEVGCLPNLDLCCVDIQRNRALSLAEVSRQAFPDVLLMLMADADISPMTYVKPGIMAASLLLRPFSDRIIRAAILDSFRHYRRKIRQLLDANERFVLETKQGKQSVSYADIEFFEAREKKIFLSTAKSDSPFYATLDRLAETLPKQFVRCHKSFIVNVYNISRIVYAENSVCLTSGRAIPFSRSYKSAIKEVAL